MNKEDILINTIIESYKVLMVVFCIKTLIRTKDWKLHSKEIIEQILGVYIANEIRNNPL